TFSATGSLAIGRASPTATALADGTVLVVGGYGVSGAMEPLAGVEIYQPATGTFVTTAGLATGRVDHTATLLTDGSVLIASGSGRLISGLASAEIFRADDSALPAITVHPADQTVTLGHSQLVTVGATE